MARNDLLMPGTFKCALFDMDGTLVDSTALVEQEWKQWARSKSLDPEFVATLAHGRRTEDVIQQHLPGCNLQEEVTAFVDMASRLSQDSVAEIPGAVKFVKSIHPDRWAVVTSAPGNIARQRLEKCGFPPPPCLVGADQVRVGKPDPEGYLTASRRMNQRPSDCLVFEDAPAGVVAGQRAGMRVVVLRTTHPHEDFGDCVVVPDFTYIAVENMDEFQMILRVAS